MIAMLGMSEIPRVETHGGLIFRKLGNRNVESRKGTVMGESSVAIDKKKLSALLEVHFAHSKGAIANDIRKKLAI